MTDRERVEASFAPEFAGSGAPSPRKVPGLSRQRWAEILGLLGFASGAEIGVRQGAFSLALCRAIPGLRLLAVDPWKAYRSHPSQRRQEENYRVACERLAPYRVDVRRQSSVEAVRTVPMASLDFVYIDGNHRYQYVRADIRRWSRRVRPGGIVAGDDYGHPDVARAVHEQVTRDGVAAWYLLDDPGRRNRRGEVFTSWFWVQGR